MYASQTCNLYLYRRITLRPAAYASWVQSFFFLPRFRPLCRRESYNIFSFFFLFDNYDYYGIIRSRVLKLMSVGSIDFCFTLFFFYSQNYYNVYNNIVLIFCRFRIQRKYLRVVVCFLRPSRGDSDVLLPSESLSSVYIIYCSRGRSIKTYKDTIIK